MSERPTEDRRRDEHRSWARCSSICREMGSTLMKTSYSAIFNEALDFTCVLGDAKRDMIACGGFLPGAYRRHASRHQELCARDGAREAGRGRCHHAQRPLPGQPAYAATRAFFMPFFEDGELMGYAVSIGHVAEIGGIVHGSYGQLRHGNLSRGHSCAAESTSSAAVRMPRKCASSSSPNVRTYAPFNWRRSARDDQRLRDRSASRMSALIEKYGQGTLLRADRCAHPLFRGPYARGDRGHPGRALQLRGPHGGRWNRGPASARSRPMSSCRETSWSPISHAATRRRAVRSMRLSESPGRPGSTPCSTSPTRRSRATPGAIAPSAFSRAPASVALVDYPAPDVGGNTETHLRLCYAVIAALSERVPDRTFAPNAGSHCNFLFGGQHPATGEYYVS